MRGTRRPIWEDDQNVNGGYWKLKVPKVHTVSTIFIRGSLDRWTGLKTAILKTTVWKELVLACIGEQFQDECYTNDEVTGISVSVRERKRFLKYFLVIQIFLELKFGAWRYFKTDKREDLVQIWNSNSQHADKATIIQKVKKLVPHVQFLAVFYKGKLSISSHRFLVGSGIHGQKPLEPRTAPRPRKYEKFSTGPGVKWAGFLPKMSIRK